MHICFRRSMEDHGFIKAHWRISIKDYSRGKNFKELSAPAPLF